MFSLRDLCARHAASPAIVPAGARRATGIASLDEVLSGGLARGRIHEVYAPCAEDAGGAAGFAALLAAWFAEDGGHQIAWLHERQSWRDGGIVQGAGLSALGSRPGDFLFVQADDRKALLKACLDAARCTGLGAAVMQAQGPLPELTLTASRQLLLAAQTSRVTLLLLRIGADPVPSAAETRWAVTSAPSRALAAQAPGQPAFDITLLRQKSGPSGMSWRVEWDRERASFRDAQASGAVVSVPVRRPAADSGAGPLRRIA
jgi:protein ImuA